MSGGGRVENYLFIPCIGINYGIFKKEKELGLVAWARSPSYLGGEGRKIVSPAIWDPGQEDGLSQEFKTSLCNIARTCVFLLLLLLFSFLKKERE